MVSVRFSIRWTEPELGLPLELTVQYSAPVSSSASFPIGPRRREGDLPAAHRRGVDAGAVGPVQVRVVHNDCGRVSVATWTAAPPFFPVDQIALPFE